MDLILYGYVAGRNSCITQPEGYRAPLWNRVFVGGPYCFPIGEVGVWQRLAKQTNPKPTVPTGSGGLLETWDEESEIQIWAHTWSGLVRAGLTAWHVCVVKRCPKYDAA